MADVLPLAIAIAASPFPVIPAILLLFTPQARRSSAAFLAGWFAGVALVTAIFTLVADAIDILDTPPAWVSWTRAVLGAVLLIWGIAKWLGRRKPQPAPAWMASLTSASPRRAARLGLVLSAANPKIILLAAAGGLSIGNEVVGTRDQVLMVLLFAVVGSLSVAIPVVSFLVAGDRVLRPLGRARDWLERNNSAVMAVVFIVLGAVLLVKGISAL